MPNVSRHILLALLLLTAAACATQRKLGRIREGQTPSASLSLGEDMSRIPEIQKRSVTRDTLKVKDDDGREFLIMKAIKDDDGEMVANEVLDAAVVTARFRNVSEHKGKVDLAFQIIVPGSMQDSRWQLRFYPDMFVLGDSLRLEPVIITGAAYRKAQLRGYQQYNRFLSKIVSDTTRFINVRLLEIFLERNIPELYAFKTDSTIVSDEQFATCYGVTQRQAVEHYTNQIARRLNNYRKSRIGKMYRRWVKAPIVTDGIRLDTVMVSPAGDFIYNYVQTINTRPRLRKVDIVLSGEIFEQDKVLYTIPSSEPLTFYISSISAFADGRERYLTKVVERRAEANTACYVDFAVGKSNIDLSLGYNAEEIGRIKDNLAQLMENTNYDLDSIVVDASASPEGKVAANEKLAHQRSVSISKYLQDYIRAYQDSLSEAVGVLVDEEGKMSVRKNIDIPFISRSSGENWRMLDFFVLRDTVMTEGEKSNYSELSTISNLDAREQLMQKQKYYPYMRRSLYPRLRTVKFSFFLHRKGMVKDTVHTTVLDSVYMEGVKALKEMDYNLAISLLAPYRDFNTAVAYVALDRNASALEILSPLPRSPEVNYLLAVLYSRTGEPEKAVQCYLSACRQNHSYVYRGNLDPEISLLIKTYGLNKDDGDDLL